MHARCLDCDKEYPSTAPMDYGLCPACQAIEDQMYRPMPIPDDLPTWKYSRRAMQERLGVTGDRDE